MNYNGLNKLLASSCSQRWCVQSSTEFCAVISQWSNGFYPFFWTLIVCTQSFPSLQCLGSGSLKPETGQRKPRGLSEDSAEPLLHREFPPPTASACTQQSFWTDCWPVISQRNSISLLWSPFSWLVSRWSGDFQVRQGNLYTECCPLWALPLFLTSFPECPDLGLDSWAALRPQPVEAPQMYAPKSNPCPLVHSLWPWFTYLYSRKNIENSQKISLKIFYRKLNENKMSLYDYKNEIS